VNRLNSCTPYTADCTVRQTMLPETCLKLHGAEMSFLLSRRMLLGFLKTVLSSGFLSKETVSDFCFCRKRSWRALQHATPFILTERRRKKRSYCRRNYLYEGKILLTSKSQEPRLNHTHSCQTNSLSYFANWMAKVCPLVTKVWKLDCMAWYLLSGPTSSSHRAMPAHTTASHCNVTGNQAWAHGVLRYFECCSLHLTIYNGLLFKLNCLKDIMNYR